MEEGGGGDIYKVSNFRRRLQKRGREATPPSLLSPSCFDASAADSPLPGACYYYCIPPKKEQKMSHRSDLSLHFLSQQK